MRAQLAAEESAAEAEQAAAPPRRYARRPHLWPEAARLIDELGWLALPARNRKPVVEWRGEVLPAMPERGVLTAWWGQRFGPEIAVVTGRRSGIVVADIDPRHGGKIEALWALGWPQETVQARSPRDGWHVYAACPADGLRSLPKYAPGIELKADGALVFVPPSRKTGGGQYVWVPGHSPFERP